MAVKLALEENTEFFEKNRGKVVYWATDSQNNYIFLKRGSRKRHIQRTALAVKELEIKYEITIIPVWVEREASIIKVADEGSKLHLSSDEWSIGDNDFQFIQDSLEVTCDVDAFASQENAKRVQRCEFLCPKAEQRQSLLGLSTSGLSGTNFCALENTIEH